MSKPYPLRSGLSGLLAALALIGCGGDSNQADPYYGVDQASDGTNNFFDTKFLAQTCGNSGALPCRDSAVKYACPSSQTNTCYPAQEGFSQGGPIYFYNLVSMSATITPTKTCVAGATCASGSVPNPIPVSVADPQLLGGGGMHVDLIQGSCTPGPAYNGNVQRTTSYSTTTQFPLFNALPLATTAFGAIVYPIAATYTVTLNAQENCNDLKDWRSIANSTNPGGGSYGATRSANPSGYRLMAPIDPNYTVPAYAAPGTTPKYPLAPIPGALNPNYGAELGWFEGLQVPFLDGGPIPTTTVTNPDGSTGTALQAMEGVLVDPASSSSFSDVTDQKVVLLPYPPGDPNYSPIVRLHDYHLQSGQTIGTVTSICQQEPCAATSADFSKASATPYYIIFIASTPQQ